MSEHLTEEEWREREKKKTEKKSVYHKYIQLTEEDKKNGYVMVDVYHVLRLFGVTDQNLGHAIKKLLVPGLRSGGKSVAQDIGEAIWTLQRWQELERRTPQLPAGVSVSGTTITTQTYLGPVTLPVTHIEK